MRLALALGRTVEELDATLTHAEWLRWVAFQATCDLPDGFLVTGQLGALVASAAGSKRAKPQDFAPYYKTARASVAAVKSFILAAGAVFLGNQPKRNPDDPPPD
jgi:hypothetical protein